MNAYSNDLRQKIIESWLDNEGKPAELATRFKVHVATIYRYINLFRDKGSVKKENKISKRPRKIDGGGDQFLSQQIQKKPEVTLEELKQKFFKKFGISVTLKTISRHLKEMNITRKKNSIC